MRLRWPQINRAKARACLVTAVFAVEVSYDVDRLLGQVEVLGGGCGSARGDQPAQRVGAPVVSLDDPVQVGLLLVP